MANIIEILVTSKNLATPGFASATAGARGLSGAMGKMAAVSTAALIGIGVESVKMASTYQSSTTRLVTSAGESLKNIDMVRKGMLDMAGQVGVSADDLSKAMYYVEAAGFHGADGLTALKSAAEGAAAEGADTTQVAKALTDILVDYHLKASEAADVTSKMVAAISHGKTNLQEFSGAFANIVPAASAAGISFTDVMAALAQMTNHGFTARRASMNLAQALRSLLNPTNVMKESFKDFGVSTEELRKKLHGANGLTDAMQYLAEKAQKGGKEGTPEFAAALKLLMGTASGANAALATVGENVKSTSDTIKAIGGATADSSGKVMGFAEVQKNLGQQMKQLNAAFGSMLIQIGDRLIPVLTTLVTWMNKHKTVVEVTIASLGILMAALIAYSVYVKTAAMVTAIWEGAQIALDEAMDANPIMLIVIAVGLLVVGVIEAYKHSKTFRDIINDIGKVAVVVGKAVVIAFKAIWKGAEAAFNWIKDHWQLLLAILLGPIGLAVDAIATHWKTIAGGAKWAVGFIKDHWRLLLAILFGPVGAAVAVISKYWHQIIDGASAVLGWMKSHWKIIASLVSGPFAPAVYLILRYWRQITKGAQAVIHWIASQWKVLTHVLSGPFSAAWSLIRPILNQIGSLVDNTIGKVSGLTSKIGSAASSVGGFFGFAHGGTVGAAATGGTRSGLTMVGEQGPELVHLPAGSHVMSNPDTRRAMGGGGGGDGSPMVVVLQMDGHELSRLLINPLRRTVRHIGGRGPNSVQAALGT